MIVNSDVKVIFFIIQIFMIFRKLTIIKMNGNKLELEPH